MPAFTKPSERTVAAFSAGVDKLDGVERRQMFGYPAAFLGGNMFICVFQDRIMVRLSPDDRMAALSLAGARMFEPLPGRPMKEYVELPATIVAERAELDKWFRQAREYATALPPKSAKKKKTPK